MAQSETAPPAATEPVWPWYKTAAASLLVVATALFLLAFGKAGAPRETAPGHLEDPPGPLPNPNIPTPS